jgi:hypothetical protein
VDYALALMALAVIALLAVALFVLAACQAKGNDILSEIRDAILRELDGRAPGEPLPSAPSYPPLQPGQCAEDARAYLARARAEDVGAMTGRVEMGQPGMASPAARRRAWVPCSPDGSRVGDVEPTPVSPRDYLSAMQPVVGANGLPLAPQRQAVEVVPSPLADSGPLALPELSEDEERPGWERQSGTWTREDGR